MGESLLRSSRVGLYSENESHIRGGYWGGIVCGAGVWYGVVDGRSGLDGGDSGWITTLKIKLGAYFRRIDVGIAFLFLLGKFFKC